METYHLKVAGLERDLPVCPLGNGVSIAGFVMFSDVELTVACATELLKKVPESKKVIRVKSPVNVVNSVGGGVTEDVTSGAGDGFDYEETTDLDSIASMPDGFDEPA